MRYQLFARSISLIAIFGLSLDAWSQEYDIGPPTNVNVFRYDNGLVPKWEPPMNAPEGSNYRYEVTLNGGEPLPETSGLQYLIPDLEPSTTYEISIYGLASDPNDPFNYIRVTEAAVVSATTLVPGEGIETSRISTGTTTASTSVRGQHPDISKDGRWVVYEKQVQEAGLDFQIELVDLQQGASQIISRNSSGEFADGVCSYPVISNDGRYVAFLSEAQNLTLDAIAGARENVFLYDTQTQGVTLVSTIPGGGGANIDCSNLSISGDGSTVAFISRATNLVEPNLETATWHGYLYSVGSGDLSILPNDQTSTSVFTFPSVGETVDIAVNGDASLILKTFRFEDERGLYGADEVLYIYNPATDESVSITPKSGGVGAIAISDDGRYASFEWQTGNASTARITPNDPFNALGFYLYDVIEDSKELLGKTPFGTPPSRASIRASALSDDGRFAIYSTFSDSFDISDTNGAYDVFMNDRLTGKVRRISEASDGTEGNGDSGADSTNSGDFGPIGISGDGSRVVYNSRASNLVPDDTNSREDVFLTEVAIESADMNEPVWPDGSSLNADEIGATLVTLSWTAAVDGEGNLAGYRVYQDDVVVGSTTDEQQSFSVTGLQPETSYQFRVEALDAASNESTNGPVLPVTTGSLSSGGASLAAPAVSGGIIRLTWDPASGDIANYLVQRQETGSENWETLAEPAVGATSYEDGSLPSGATYNYRVLIQPLGGGEPVTHTQTVEATAPELFIDESLAQLPRAGVFPTTLTQGGSVALSLRGEPNRTAQAVIAYSAWSSDQPALGESPQAQEAIVALTEAASTAGLYSSDWTLPVRTASIESVSLQLDDGYGNQISQSVSDLPRDVEARFNFSLLTPGGFGIVDQIKVSLWSQSTATGRSQVFESAGQFTGVGLPGAADFELKVFGDNKLASQTDGIVLRSGLLTTLEQTVLPPPQLETIIKDYSGKTREGIRISVTDKNTSRPIATAVSDEEGRATPGEGQNLFARGMQLTYAVSDLPWDLGDTSGDIVVPSDDTPIEIQIPRSGLLFDPGTLTVQVTDSSGQPIEGARVVSESLERRVVERGTGNTDASGSFVYDGAIGRNLLVVSPPRSSLLGKASTTVTVPENGSLSTTVELPTLYPQRISIPRIQLTDATGATQSFSTLDRPDLARRIQIRIVRDGELFADVIENGRVNGELQAVANLPDGAGYTVTIDANEIGYGSESIQATVEGSGEIILDPLQLEMSAGNYLTATLFGEGSIPFSNDTPWVASLVAVDQDDEGERIFGRGPNLVFPNADIGPHLLTIERSDRSAAARQVEIAIVSGSNDLGEIAVVPTGLLARARQTTFSSLPSTVSPGALIRANLTLSNPRISELVDVTASVTLPQGVDFVEGSLVVDDIAVSPSIVDGELQIPYGSIDESSEEIAIFQLQVSPDFAGSSFELPARVSYQGARDSAANEFIGVARHELIRGPTIFGPEQVGQRKLEVSGRAPAGKVVILDGGIPVGQANVSEAGYWRQEIVLTEPKTPYWHTLTAQWYSPDLTETEVSSSLAVLRNPNVARPVRLRFRQPTDEADSQVELQLVARFPDVGDWTEFEVPEGGPARFWRRILAGFPFEFEVEFNQPDFVEDVVLEVEGPAGGTALATKGEDGIYRARIEASRDADWNAGPIKVSWAPRTGQEIPRWTNDLEFGEIEILEPEEETIQVSSIDTKAGTNGVADHRFSTPFEHPDYRGNFTLSLSSGRTLDPPRPSVSYPGGSISYASDDAPMYNGSYSYSYSSNQFSASITGYIPVERFADRDRAAPAFGETPILVAISATDSQVQLAWSPALDDNWVESYSIYQGDTLVASVEGDALSAMVDGLVSGQSYDFSLRANDPTGKSSAPVNLIVDFQGSNTETSPAPLHSAVVNLPVLGLVNVTQIVSASGNWVKTTTNLVSNRLGPAVDVFTLGKDIYDERELFERFEEMQESLENCEGVPPFEKAFLDQEIREAAEASVAKNILGTTLTVASVSFAATGVGAPLSAALAVTSLATGYIAGDVADREIQGAEDAYQDILDAYPECEEDECEEGENCEDEDSDDDKRKRKRRSESTVADPTWKIDPSGFVYEVVEENRLSGVTATIFTAPEETGPWSPWDAENYGEINPQVTGSGGNYRWDVPAGFWLVEYKKDGYETAYSDVLPVPPPHFDVNIPVKSLAPPQVELVRSLQSGESVELSFVSYVDISSVSVGTIRIRDNEGDYIAGSIAPIEESLADNPHDQIDALNVARRFLFTPDEAMTQGATYTFEIEGVVESYGGVPIGGLLEVAFEVADNYEGVYFGSFSPDGGAWVARVGEAGDIELRGHDGAVGGSYVGSGLVDESGAFSIDTPIFGDGAAFEGQIETGSIDGTVSIVSYTASGSRVAGTSGDLVPSAELLGAVSLSADTLVDLVYADTEALLVVNGSLANGAVQLALDDAGQANGALSDGSQVFVDLSSDGGQFTGTLQPAGTEDVYELLGTTQSVGGGARLVNVSGRGVVGSSENSMIAGYVLWGPDANETNEMVVRAVGPTLASQLEVDGALTDPRLSLFKSTGPSTAAELLLENDQWQSGATLQEIDAVFAGLGAFLLDENSEDAAVIEGFQRGLYTAVAQSTTGAPGIALVEVYDSSLLGGPQSQLSVVNLSIRGRVGTGDEILIAGFVVDGAAPVRVLIRGVGPALGAQGVGDPLADPELSLFRLSDLALVNDDWGDYLPDASAMSNLFANVGAFAFDDQSLDSAMVVWLAPGLYTTHLSGIGGQEGIGLIEIYVVENPF